MTDAAKLSKNAKAVPKRLETWLIMDKAESMYIYTIFGKEGATIFSTITLAFLDQFL